MSMTTIRELSVEDYNGWKVLYSDYASVWKEDISEERLEKLYCMITEQAGAVCGIGAIDSSELIGFAHYIKYPCTYSMGVTCYLQDLYVAPKVRNKGIARFLMENLFERGKKEGWRNLHWHTRPDNQKAINFYSKIAQKSDRIYFEKNFIGR